MKLSKKSQARQRAIAKMVASGKALGGLLAGLVAAAIPGCRDNSPGARMGEVLPQNVSGCNLSRRSV